MHSVNIIWQHWKYQFVKGIWQCIFFIYYKQAGLSCGVRLRDYQGRSSWHLIRFFHQLSLNCVAYWTKKAYWLPSPPTSGNQQQNIALGDKPLHGHLSRKMWLIQSTWSSLQMCFCSWMMHLLHFCSFA